MKKTLAVLIALIMLLGCMPAVLAEEPAANQPHFTPKNFPWIIGSKDAVNDSDTMPPLWFTDDAPDLPYIDLYDWARMMTIVVTNGGTEPGYVLNVAPGLEEHTQ